MFQIIKKILFLCCSVGVVISLTGCGGGGGGGGGSGSSASPIGVWQGTSSTGYQLELMVLPNGKFYNLLGTMSGNTFLISGFDSGTYTGGISGSMTEYYYTGQTFTGTLTGSVSGSQITGSASYNNGSNPTFTLSPLSGYTFNTAASLSNTSGNWTGVLLDGTSASVSVQSNGSFTGSSGGCSFSGQITADSSGDNFFDTTLTFGASPCVNASQTYTGIAIEYPTNTGHSQLGVIVDNNANTSGFLFIAQR